MNEELDELLKCFSRKRVINYYRREREAQESTDGESLEDIQQTAEEVDMKLLDDFLHFMQTRNINKLDDSLSKRIEEFRNFLTRIEEEIKIEVSSATPEQNEYYQELIRMLEKQRHSVELVKQTFGSLEPFELSGALLDYFEMLKEFQEASFKYQQNYRDHLIHSLRVFLLIISILNAMGDIWICILRRFLCKNLRNLGIRISKKQFAEVLNPEELWDCSIQGVSIMSFFHDIGMVYSRYREMVDGLEERIFADRSRTGMEGDRSIFTYKPILRLKHEAVGEIKGRISIFSEALGKMHPEYEELTTILNHVFGSIENSEKETEEAESESPASNDKKLHGVYALLNIYTYQVIERRFLDSIRDLERESKEVERYRSSAFRAYRSNLESGAKIPPDTLLDNESRGNINKQKEILRTLILCEVFNCILIHDMDGFPYMSPLSELLIFADNAQEWNRIAFEGGCKKQYEKDQIEICINKCEKACLLILDFYEKKMFEGSESLNTLMDMCTKRYSCEIEAGVFGIFYRIKASDYETRRPSQAVFVCPHLEVGKGRIPLEDTGDISLDMFCQYCQYTDR
ncbi:MAG: hypothetical protein HXS52_10640 [Theionarchaea archaeon]|nr:hypothetical protein [Theionarchaea archaeon]